MVNATTEPLQYMGLALLIDTEAYEAAACDPFFDDVVLLVHFDEPEDGATSDTARVPTGYTLSNGDLTVENTSAAGTIHQQVDRDFDIDGSEMLYVEFVCDVVGASNAYVGIVPESASYTTQTVASHVGLNNAGELFVSGTNAGTGITGGFNDGDVIMLAIHGSALKLWWGKNGTWEQVTFPQRGRADIRSITLIQAIGGLP